MAVIHFDLNDIENEPSDEALASLMEAVAEEVRRKELVRRQQLKERLEKAMREAHGRFDETDFNR